MLCHTEADLPFVIRRIGSVSFSTAFFRRSRYVTNPAIPSRTKPNTNLRGSTQTFLVKEMVYIPPLSLTWNPSIFLCNPCGFGVSCSSVVEYQKGINPLGGSVCDTLRAPFVFLLGEFWNSPSGVSIGVCPNSRRKPPRPPSKPWLRFLGCKHFSSWNNQCPPSNVHVNDLEVIYTSSPF